MRTIKRTVGLFNRKPDEFILCFALAGLFLVVGVPGILDLYLAYTQPGSMLAMSACS